MSTLAGGGIAGGTYSGYGDGIGSAATFGSPNSIAIDAIGRLRIGDGAVGNQNVRMISSTGNNNNYNNNNDINIT